MFVHRRYKKLMRRSDERILSLPDRATYRNPPPQLPLLSSASSLKKNRTQVQSEKYCISEASEAEELNIAILSRVSMFRIIEFQHSRTPLPLRRGIQADTRNKFPRAAVAS